MKNKHLSMLPLAAAWLLCTGAVAQTTGTTRVCHSGEAAGSGRCPAQPALGAAATDWGCTRDDASGLTWELKTIDGGPRDRERTYTNFSADYDPSRTRGGATDASGYVKDVNARGLCGASDWRLPTRGELLGLVRHGVPAKGLAIDEGAFPNSANKAAKSVYWAAGAFAANRTQGWGVDMTDGVAGDDNRSIYYAVRLVRGTTASPAPQAGADAAEVRSGRLVWRRCAEGMAWNGSACTGNAGRYDWAAAQQRAQDAARGGVAWRLPTLQELVSIVDDSRTNPATDPVWFPATPPVRFWAATPSAGDGRYQWSVDFATGAIGDHAYRSDRHALRLVRNAN